MTRPIPDAQARQTALEPARSFIVQAPAGAGKTGLLTQRFLRLLSAVDAPDEILAITFTRKAATEMRNRILDALRDAEAGKTAENPHEALTLSLAAAALNRSNDLGWSLTEDPGRLQVRTIDSLCHRLARRLPLLSGNGGAAAPVDDASELYTLAATRTLALVDDDAFGAPVATLLNHLDNNPLRARGLLSSMLARRDQWLRHLGGDHHGRLSREALEAGLALLVDEVLDAIDAKVPRDLADDLWELALFARDNLQEEKRDTALGRWDGIAPTVDTDHRLGRWDAIRHLLLTQSGDLRRPGGLNRTTGFPATDKATKARMGALLEALENHPVFVERLARVEGLPNPVYSQAQWALLEQLPTLLNLAYAQLNLLFAERGVTDHTEVNAAAARALGTEDAPTDLALALDYRLSHILVDEFQDTSRTQFDLLLRLTAGWQIGDGHSFFAVGDPMQSIYRFRQAEVGLFLEARRRGLGDLPLESLVLQTNFRSQGQIIDWVNDTFSAVFPDEDDLNRGAIRYASAEAFHAPSANGGIRVHPLFDRNGEEEARLVADLIGDALNAGHANIAVLARSRTHLHAVAGELARRSLPFQAVDVQRLGDRLAVRELRALTRALVLPGDRAAWLAVLRAPWCGLTLTDLTTLAGDDTHTETLGLLADTGRKVKLSADGRQRADRAFAILSEAVANRRRRSLGQTVESAWLSLGGPACLQSRADLAAARAFLDLLALHESAGDLPLLQRLDEALSGLYAPPDPDAPSTVQLMTMHKAKGLEFDTVILPGLGRAPRSDERELVQWLEFEGDDGEPHLVPAPIAESESGTDPLEQLLRRTEKDKQSLETARLLYVAATRARKALHLVGAVNPVEDPDDLAPRRDTLLDPLWPVVADDFRRALAERAGVPETIETAPSAGEAGPLPLVRCTTLWQPPAMRDVVAAGGAPAADMEEPEYLWAGSSARHIGTLIHRHLERIAEQGATHWNAERILALRPRIERSLEALSVTGSALPDAAERVIAGLTNTLADERGRWILAAHEHARCEYALSAVIDGRPMNLVLDRTFVDAEGVRWIIDYKTGSHEGARVEEFLDREQERYRPQLERYAEVMARLHPDATIRLGLYFPLLRGWREWSRGAAG